MRFRSVAVVAFVIGLLFPVTQVAAQESVGIRFAAPAEVTLPSPWLSTLRVLAARGDSDALVSGAAEFLSDLRRVLPTSGGIACCDYTSGYVMVVFTSTDAQGKPSLSHVLVHNSGTQGPTLPGLKGPDRPLLEVFIAEDSSVEITGAVEIERVVSPVLKQVGDFASIVIGKIGLPGALGTLPNLRKMTVAKDSSSPSHKYAVTLGSVAFPYSRAKLTVRHAVSVAQPIVHMKALTSVTAADLREKQVVQNWEALLRDIAIQLRKQKGSRDGASMTQVLDLDRLKQSGNVPTVTCANLIDAIEKALIDQLDKDACRFAIADQADCVKSLKAILSDSVKNAVTAGTCALEPAGAIASAFVPLTFPATRITGTTLLNNQPKDRYNFGLASGYIGWLGSTSDHPRTSIQSGKIASNPFARSITMGVVNLPVWGYDSSTFDMTMAERIRPFIGVPFSPNFGVAVGGSYSFTRTIALNIGYARLWYDTPATGEGLDLAPVNKDRPFEAASVGAWFVAAGFVFK